MYMVHFRRITSGIVFALAIALSCIQCLPPEYGAQQQEKAGIVNLDLNNKQIRKLYNFADERKTDSLLTYLQHPNPSFRYVAALSFASVRDSNAISALGKLLSDPVEDVSIAAAFALGQIGSLRAEPILVAAFRSNDSTSSHQRFNAAVLEAIGRCGSVVSLKNIAQIKTYQATDTLLLEGQCKALYRFGLRKLVDPAGTAKMVEYVFNDRIPESARLMAAHYLGRTPAVIPDSAQAVKIAAAFVRAANNPDIRLPLTKALGRSQTSPAFGILSKVIKNEPDWRVKCGVIRALGNYAYDTVRALVIPSLQDPNPHVSLCAAELFITKGQAKDGDFYWRIAREQAGNMPLTTQIALFQASNRWLSGKSEPESKDFVNYRLREMFLGAKSPYERAACLSALAEFGWQYRWIHEKGFADPHPAVKSAAVEALVKIMRRPDFYSFFGESGRAVRRELHGFLREMVAGGDPGMIASGAAAFRIPSHNFLSLRDTARIGDLQTALQKLKLPRDVEAYAALDSALAYFSEQAYRPAPAPKYSRPLDWQRLTIVGDKTEVSIQTARGTIVLELYPHLAPGSVANFLELAGTGFFNGKNFHRVVPGFVIQGGCPRGDGYGGLDYSIRTEISLNTFDAEGVLGMASAGPDTEGTQFFITQAAAPHLDGAYTIFGKVKSGMDVVHQILPGDDMKQVTVKYQ